MLTLVDNTITILKSKHNFQEIYPHHIPTDLVCLSKFLTMRFGRKLFSDKRFKRIKEEVILREYIYFPIKFKSIDFFSENYRLSIRNNYVTY